MLYVKAGEASKLLGVSIQTLRKYSKEGIVKVIRSPGGHYLYDIESATKVKDDKDIQRNVCYCRVSSYGQASDLDSQVLYMERKYPTYDIITDIGSGVNFNRKGLLKIIDYAIKGELKTLVISYKDRLCRIGYDLIEHILIEYSNTKIIVDKQKEDETLEEEITKDILQIITVYTAKIHGLRSYKVDT